MTDPPLPTTPLPLGAASQIKLEPSLASPVIRLKSMSEIRKPLTTPQPGTSLLINNNLNTRLRPRILTSGNLARSKTILIRPNTSNNIVSLNNGQKIIVSGMPGIRQPAPVNNPIRTVINSSGTIMNSLGQLNPIQTIRMDPNDIIAGSPTGNTGGKRIVLLSRPEMTKTTNTMTPGTVPLRMKMADGTYKLVQAQLNPQPRAPPPRLPTEPLFQPRIVQTGSVITARTPQQQIIRLAPNRPQNPTFIRVNTPTMRIMPKNNVIHQGSVLKTNQPNTAFKILPGSSSLIRADSPSLGNFVGSGVKIVTMGPQQRLQQLSQNAQKQKLINVPMHNRTRVIQGHSADFQTIHYREINRQ